MNQWTTIIGESPPLDRVSVNIDNIGNIGNITKPILDPILLNVQISKSKRYSFIQTQDIFQKNINKNDTKDSS